MALKIKNIDNSLALHRWGGVDVVSGATYTCADHREAMLFGNDTSFLLDYAYNKAEVYEDTIKFADYNLAINSLKDYSIPNPKTEDYRDITAINRIPLGYTIYPTGKSDAHQASGYRAGSDMKFDADNKVREFRLFHHWYGIGGRLIWEGADLDDHMDAVLVAPATVGVSGTGDFIKVEVIPSSGLSVFVPYTPGAGNWSLNLAEKFTGSDTLKCTPVPVPGNTGFFDYNSTTNSLTINYQQKGGYNLYDFDANLFQFASRIWGRKQDGSESSLEITNVVGKLLYSNWKVKFTLTTNKTSGIKVGLTMTTAVKKNI